MLVLLRLLLRKWHSGERQCLLHCSTFKSEAYRPESQSINNSCHYHTKIGIAVQNCGAETRDPPGHAEREGGMVWVAVSYSVGIRIYLSCRWVVTEQREHGQWWGWAASMLAVWRLVDRYIPPMWSGAGRARTSPAAPAHARTPSTVVHLLQHPHIMISDGSRAPLQPPPSSTSTTTTRQHTPSYLRPRHQMLMP